jgi:hypothetical protein
MVQGRPSCDNCREGRRRTLFKWRYILFSPRDEAMFSEALRELYPATQFFQSSERINPQSSLVNLPDLYADILITVPDDPRLEIGSDQSSPRGRHQLPSSFRLAYKQSAWDWACLPNMSYDPPTINVGEISGSYEPEDPSHAVFLKIVRQVWKVIERLATNRYKSGHPLGNQLSGGDSLLMKNAVPGYAWLGHHALEWCREKPRRMLNGCWRPCDDWQVPGNDWYQAMRRKTAEKYGNDLGTQPTSPSSTYHPEVG